MKIRKELVVLESIGLYIILIVIYCDLERENYKVVKFYMNISSYFEPPSFKRRPPMSATH